MFRLLYYAAIMQELGSHFFIGLETAIKRCQTNFQPAFLEDICESAFGQATMQRHLAAFKNPEPGPMPTRFFLCTEPFAGFRLLRLNAIFFCILYFELCTLNFANQSTKY